MHALHLEQFIGHSGYLIYYADHFVVTPYVLCSRWIINHDIGYVRQTEILPQMSTLNTLQ